MKPSFTILLFTLFSIFYCKTLQAQDRINTLQGGTISKLKIISLGKDSITYKLKKSDVISAISIKEVASVIKDGASYYYGPNYKPYNDTAAVANSEKTITQKTQKKTFNAGNMLIEASNDFLGLTITPLITTSLSYGMLLAGVAPVAITVASIGGLIVTVVYIVKYIKHLKLAGQQLQLMEQSIKFE